MESPYHERESFKIRDDGEDLGRGFSIMQESSRLRIWVNFMVFRSTSMFRAMHASIYDHDPYVLELIMKLHNSSKMGK
jgi:hypothetical protein